MTDLFSYAEEAARRRDAGMARATGAQECRSPGFSELAYDALVELARRQPTIHVDDYLTFFPLRPERPNSLGAVWQRAIRNGVIRHSGQVRPCTVDAGKHKHQSPIYSSLIFKSVPA